MLKCRNCDRIFENDEVKFKRVCFEQEFGVSDLFDSRTYTNIEVCPYCEDKDIIELEQCDCCEEWFEELYDTEGLINGGIGFICEQCFKDNEVQ